MNLLGRIAISLLASRQEGKKSHVELASFKSVLRKDLDSFFSAQYVDMGIVLNSGGLRWGPRFCIFAKPPGCAHTAGGWGTLLSSRALGAGVRNVGREDSVECGCPHKDLALFLHSFAEERRNKGGTYVILELNLSTDSELWNFALD